MLAARRIPFRHTGELRGGAVIPVTAAARSGVTVFRSTGVSGIALYRGDTLISQSGDALYVPPYETHGYDNIGDGVFTFLCVVPLNIDA